MIKLLWFDTETTGTYPVMHDIIHIAGKVIIGKEVKDEFEFFCQPFNYKYINAEALEVNGRVAGPRCWLAADFARPVTVSDAE